MIEQKEIQSKLMEFEVLLLGMNAYGSLNLTEYKIIMNYLKGSFDYIPIEICESDAFEDIDTKK